MYHTLTFSFCTSLTFALVMCKNSFNLEKFGYSEVQIPNEQLLIEYTKTSAPRTARQTTSFICVPAGTCITNTTIPGIDPRIVSPGQTTTSPPPPTTCPTGQEACYPTTGALQCGRRYVTNVATTDGTATPGAFPWQAYVRNQTGYSGSGVLVDSLHVLTAAHKVYLNTATPTNVIVNIGVSNPSTSLTTSQQRTVARIVVHPSFNISTLRNNIAVLRLSSAISVGYQVNVGTACLPSSTASYVGQRCVVSGWGKTGFATNDAPTSPQKQVFVSIVNYTTCRTAMAGATVLGSNVDIYLDSVGEICAGGEANKDACTYDGGAPLVCPDATGNFNVAGLVIWGRGCGTPGVYGVYVNVPYYSAWITSTIAQLNAG